MSLVCCKNLWFNSSGLVVLFGPLLLQLNAKSGHAFASTPCCTRFCARKHEITGHNKHRIRKFALWLCLCVFDKGSVWYTCPVDIFCSHLAYILGHWQPPLPPLAVGVAAPPLPTPRDRFVLIDLGDATPQLVPRMHGAHSGHASQWQNNCFNMCAGSGGWDPTHASEAAKSTCSNPS